MSEAADANIIGSPFIELQSVDSTNNYARQQIHAGLAQHGMAFFAHEQVAGRGQRGRIWTSEKNMNIALSAVVKPHSLTVSKQFQLSACVAVAVYEFLVKYTIDKTSIKWPNDLYWQDRKAGGILIDSVITSTQLSVTENWEWSIIGIGININQVKFPDTLPNPVSLKQITGRNFEPVMLAKELCVILQYYFNELITCGFDNIFRLYNRHLYKLNEKVKLKKENRVFEAFLKGISLSGKLIVQHATEEEFDFGEVEWLI